MIIAFDLAARLKAALEVNKITDIGMSITELASLIVDALRQFLEDLRRDRNAELLPIGDARSYNESLRVGKSLIGHIQELVRWHVAEPVFQPFDPIAESARFTLPEAAVDIAGRVSLAVQTALDTIPTEDLCTFANARKHSLAERRRPYKGLGILRIAIRISYYAACRADGIADGDSLSRDGYSVFAAEGHVKTPMSGTALRLGSGLILAARR